MSGDSRPGPPGSKVTETISIKDKGKSLIIDVKFSYVASHKKVPRCDG